MTIHVTADAQTQAIPRTSAAAMPRVPVMIVAVADAEAAAAVPDAAVPVVEAAAAVPDAGEGAAAPAREAAAPVPDTGEGAAVHDGDAAQESVQHLYEVALAKLNALHDGWAVAMGGLREALVDIGSGEAAA